MMYATGDGVAADSVQSLKWLLLAASRFDPSEAEMLNRAKAAVEVGFSALPKETIAIAKREASEWKPKPARQ
jgi:TPR repeat protein